MTMVLHDVEVIKETPATTRRSKRRERKKEKKRSKTIKRIPPLPAHGPAARFELPLTGFSFRARPCPYESVPRVASDQQLSLVTSRAPIAPFLLISLSFRWL